MFGCRVEDEMTFVREEVDVPTVTGIGDVFRIGVEVASVSMTDGDIELVSVGLTVAVC